MISEIVPDNFAADNEYCVFRNTPTKVPIMFSSRSFFVSLLLGNLLLIGIILGAGFLVISYEINRRAVRLTERFQEQLLVMVQRDIQESWPNIEKRVEQYCTSWSQESWFRLTIVDIEGRVLGDSEYSADKMEPHLTPDRPEILAALNGQHGEDVRRSKTRHTSYRYLASPVVKDGTVVAVVRVACPVTGILENRRMLLHGILFGFALMLLAATLLSLLLSWLWHQPLRLLNDEARKIAEGNLEPSTLVDGPLEMSQLSKSLDTMRRTVSNQLETITRQREGLQTILRHLPDAIFAMNRAAEVIYFNAAAEKLFRIESAAERPFLQEFVRNASIVEWYLERRRHVVDTPGKVERIEVGLFGRKHFLELEFVETEAEGENDAACLLIVSDLSATVRANKMKTDFVANASHELRTPLSAIRVALDNISDDVFDDKETLAKILRIVDRHVSRLDALIEDLLALHGAEDETVSCRLERTNVLEQRQWIEEFFRNKIDEKRLQFSIESDWSDESFRIDNKRLGLILQNLLDNAIKFTTAGGSIILRFGRDGDRLVVSCRDTGCGIAPEEQQRVFERFYQGDSPKTGDGRVRGTGLGLAIVKHAVERLRGTISLESRVAQGSVFTVRVPIDH